MANLISSLTAATLVFFLRHLPVSLLGIGKPFGRTSRSPLLFKYTSNIAALPAQMGEDIAVKHGGSHPNTTARQKQRVADNPQRRSSSWIGVVFGRRTMSRATVWWV